MELRWPEGGERGENWKREGREKRDRQPVGWRLLQDRSSEGVTFGSADVNGGSQTLVIDV